MAGLGLLRSRKVVSKGIDVDTPDINGTEGFTLDQVATNTALDVASNGHTTTTSRGSIIAFSKYSGDLSSGDDGFMCSFDAACSVGHMLLERRE